MFISAIHCYILWPLRKYSFKKSPQCFYSHVILNSHFGFLTLWFLFLFIHTHFFHPSPSYILLDFFSISSFLIYLLFFLKKNFLWPHIYLFIFNIPKYHLPPDMFLMIINHSYSILYSFYLLLYISIPGLNQ